MIGWIILGLWIAQIVPSAMLMGRATRYEDPRDNTSPGTMLWIALCFGPFGVLLAGFMTGWFSHLLGLRNSNRLERIIMGKPKGLRRY